MEAVQQISTDDRVLSLIQQNLVTPLNNLIGVPITQGLLLTKIALVSGANVIPHGLGHPLTGWFITRLRDGFTQIYDTQDGGASPSMYLYLHSNGSITVDLWVF